MAKKPLAQTAMNNTTEDRKVEYKDLKDLEFDSENPRFGRTAGKQRSQTEILDYIVSDFGVDDVLSSIAVNSYFVAEPLICREKTGSAKLTVVEGNRRLAACLILAGDPRAKNQQRKQEQYKQIQIENGRVGFSKVPVIRFKLHEKEKDLLSYLGVRHIAASQGWDSYAKAAWIARVVEKHAMSLKEIAEMTGDKHNTVRRLLEGYYFINQLIEEGKFVPETSIRKGRGSNKEFPFSWIYTLFGYPNARRFVDLSDEPKSKPIPTSKLEDAKLIVTAMFGDQQAGRSGAITDSRQIGNLASILDDQEKIALLKSGRLVSEIEYQTLPLDQKLRDGLSGCKTILGDLMATLNASPPNEKVATSFTPLARQVNNLSANLVRALLDTQAGKME